MSSLKWTRAVGTALLLLALSALAGAQGFVYTPAPNALTVQSGSRNNVFYVGQPVTFQISNPTDHYQVRDYYGNLVDQNSIQGTSFTVNVTDPGWYKLDIFGTANQGAPWGQVVGGTMFCIFRNNPNFPTLPPPDPNLYYQLDDEVMRGVTGMGPQRLYISNADNPAADIPRLQQEIAIDQQYYLPYDPLRNRQLIIAFPGGTSNLAGVLAVVQAFHNVVKYYEGMNEPNFNTDGASFVTQQLIPFYQTVKSVDPTLKVVGPAVVTIGQGYGLDWIGDFLGAGGGNYIDAFSFHAYNNVNGDPFLTISSLDGLNALLSQFNLSGIEKWQTEQGYMAAVFGAFQPRLEGRWTMLQMMIFEQYGIPKEHNHLWYDRSRGYWSAPMWWENFDTSLMPAPALMRVWSEELFGTTFSQTLSFGNPGDKIYLGSLFTGPGKSVAAFMCGGGTDGHVDLAVSGGNSIHYVNPWGVAYDLPVVAGRVTIPVPELPVYVELAPGQTFQVVPVNWGSNLLLQPGVTGSSSGTGMNPFTGTPNNIATLFNQAFETWYYDQNTWPWMDTNASLPGWVELDLPSVQTIDHVVVYSSPPWQLWGTLVDYQLQYYSNGQWLTIDHVQEPTNSWSIYTPMAASSADSFFSDRCVFQHAFSPVQTQKIRLFVNNVTWGGTPTQVVYNAGGQGAGPVISLREVEAYNASSQGVNPGSATSKGISSPLVSIYAPADASTFSAPANIAISATASELNGPIAKVEFFANGVKVGEKDTLQYGMAWNNVPAGNYLLTAVATDASGNTAVSAPVYVTVQSSTFTPNNPPTVSIVAPVNGASTVTPANIPIQVNAADSDGTISRVEFYSGGYLLGQATAAPFSFNWSGPVAGSYTLKAKAYDNLGASAVSNPVNITIAQGASTTSVAFVKTDTTTQGNWHGTYGSDGANVIGDAANYPLYATVNSSGYSTYIWLASTSNGAALQKIGASDRVAACWYSPTNFVIDVNLTDGQTHGIALYAIDWDGYGPRSETIEILDAVTGAVLDSHSLPSFRNGQYLVWDAKGHIQIRITNTANTNPATNALISGLFFGPPSNSQNPLSVSITNPVNGNAVSAPWSTTITSAATNSSGAVAKVEFYSNAIKIGESTTPPFAFNWTNVPVGNYTLTAIAFSGTGLSVVSSPVAVAVNNLTPYQNWAASNGLTGPNIGPLAAFSGDGMANLLKWAFGFNPTLASPGALSVSGSSVVRGRPTILTGSDGVTRLAAFCRRMDYASLGLAYTVQFSGDLVTWAASSATPTSIANDGQVEIVTVPVPALSGGQNKAFFRVNVTSP